MGRARITIVQFDQDADDPRANLERMVEDVRAHASSDLVVFPELSLHGHRMGRAPPGAARRALERAGEEAVEELDRAASEHGTRIVYGRLAGEEGRLRNVATYTDGRRRVDYAKTHVHWSEGFEPGRAFPVVREFLAPLGMLICFDAAFPEVPRILALNGAEVIVNISAIPEDFPLEHVHRRLVACSVGNQAFTVFANRTGEGFRGGSAIIGPRGDVLALAGEERILEVEVDLAEAARWRAEEPALRMRRPGIYGDIVRGADDTPK